MEILKVKLNETQTLIAYQGSRADSPQRPLVHACISFKVGPNPAGDFIACSPDDAMALLAMLDRQEKPSTP